MKPTFDVEVALPEMFKPVIVVVPKPVEETVNFPLTSNSPDGEAVPIPTFPFSRTFR